MEYVSYLYLKYVNRILTYELKPKKKQNTLRITGFIYKIPQKKNRSFVDKF